MARSLEEGRHVVAYDLRGHGRSPWSGPNTMEQHVADLAEVMDSCDIDQAGLIGESFGARIALEFSVAHQERINSLTLLDPPLGGSARRWIEEADAERRGGSYPTLDDAIEERRLVSGLIHTPRALLEEEMAEHLVADDDGEYRYRYSREAAAAALESLAGPRTDLHEVLCPTLLIRGELSETFTEEDLERASDELRRVRVETVPGGHTVLWDALAETSAHVKDFLVAKRKTA
jgi:lipase